MTSRRQQKKHQQRPVSHRYDMPAQESPDVPVTYLPLTRGEGVRQPRIFDPALKQFTYAFRAGDPIFEDEETGRRRRRARREAIDHLVGIVALTLVAEPRTARQPPAGGVDRRAGPGSGRSRLGGGTA
ncbi:hypothetical protein HD597_000227 [Nonomuraea thailandensis]|uniref:Uncharacterized protein n=1 Tax=Nonomuraea thailandensis TaxID=1188745 RepID=A0A9X2G5Y1_9ACTN|nr:hypothetical protein [Nonomuraea thailandensis]